MAEIRTLTTDQLEPGMTVSGDIANDQGAVVLYNNSKLDEKSILRLTSQGITHVRVIIGEGEVTEIDSKSVSDSGEYSAASQSTAKRQAEIQIQYLSGISNLKNVIYGISMGKTLELHHVSEITKMISSSFSTVSDAISCLNQVREIDDYTYAHSMNVATIVFLTWWLDESTTDASEASYLLRLTSRHRKVKNPR